jgi:pimeloyl-ACP methyl ester carboxylesterase
MIQHKTILLSWVLVHIVEQLEHPGPVCILLHGRWADRKSFQTIIDHYEQKQQPRVAFDLPGFGQSSIPPLDRWVSDYTSCVYEYILKKNLQDLILVWHSFGGQICIPLALSLQANLKMQIQTIILLAPAIVRHKPSMSKKLWYNLIDIAKKTLPSKLVKSIASQFWSSDYNYKPLLKPIFKRVIQEDVLTLCNQVKAPVILVGWHQDADIPPYDIEIIHKHLPDSKLVMIEWGHYDVLTFDINKLIH